jgi:5-methylcytosine-specific restriction enzyme A
MNSTEAAAYLFSWNPGEQRPSALAKYVATLKARGSVQFDWRSGSRRTLPVGSRVFLIRLGVAPKGIVGAGTTVTEPCDSPPWVRIRFDTLQEAPLIPMEVLRSPPFGAFHWSIQGSGVAVPFPLVSALERALGAHAALAGQRLPERLSATEGALTEITTYSRGRDRSIRDVALQQAKGRCEACQVDYSKVLNGEGIHVLQVHHRKQLAASDKPRLTHVEDLAVLCANCHALVHSDSRRALPVEQLRQMLTERTRRQATR